MGFEGGPPSNEKWSADDIAGMEEKYGMHQWNPPDAGNAAGAYTPTAADDAVARAADLATAGGGTANNDLRILEGPQPDVKETPGFGESVLDLLQRLGEMRRPNSAGHSRCSFRSSIPTTSRSFPMDGKTWVLVLTISPIWMSTYRPMPRTTSPPSRASRRLYRDALNKVSPLGGKNATATDYVKFYAHLHRTVEPHIQKTLDALDQHGMTEDTIIFRTADHGELGMSHGLREKAYTAYEEMIHVPLVISNPRLFPEPARTEAIYTHVDLMPTLIDLAQAEPTGIGTSMIPVMLDPATSVQDDVLFAFDDVFLLKDLPGSHIRALRDRRWTYAVYYKPGDTTFEYELYDNDADPGQLVNLLHDPQPDIKETWQRLHSRLLEKMVQTKATPAGMTFAADPSQAKD